MFFNPVYAYAMILAARQQNEVATSLARQGVLATYASSEGQEACQVAPAMVLRRYDWLFPSYRDTVAVVARGVPIQESFSLMAGALSCGYDTKRWNTAPLCTPLATHCSHAIGAVMADRLRGVNSVAIVMLGDGATSEGDFHEAVNIASVLDAPVVFLVQNNRYAISTPFGLQCNVDHLAVKGAAYGVEASRVDGNDIAATLKTLSNSVESARKEGRPLIVEADTFRTSGHTAFEDDLKYRTEDEVQRYRARDPLKLAAGLVSRVNERGWRERERIETVVRGMRPQVREAIASSRAYCGEMYRNPDFVEELKRDARHPSEGAETWQR